MISLILLFVNMYLVPCYKESTANGLQAGVFSYHLGYVSRGGIALCPDAFTVLEGDAKWFF